ncbi:ribosomal protein S15 [Plasmodium fragile]|uniref:Ribosomal protein S15 n=1 Tax=Plasmodium fragile TaxID=5857 RepID=A0A0D9QIF1_PLAFR|nr:ribosomal protein S15 [Plasmodium fragile]KJP86809.1 ribosomal protein S15 [Plasmodium fragile]
MSNGHQETPPVHGEMSSLRQQLPEGDTKEEPSKTNVKTKAQKQKEEIEEIIKKSENITVERSFSFNRSDITIKPELLKELITQKYRKLFQRHDKDCGSSEIQIIILTFKIFFLTEHMKRNKKDFACLRGLFKCVSKRRRLLVYLGRKNRDTFDKITNYFKIKKPLLPGTAEYYNKDLKYVHFRNTKRFKNSAERKKKVKAKNKKVHTDKILFGD